MGGASAGAQHEPQPGKSRYPAISEFYTEELAQLVEAMLQYDPALRPSALELLATPFATRHLATLRHSKQQLMEGLVSLLKEKPGDVSPTTMDSLSACFPF